MQRTGDLWVGCRAFVSLQGVAVCYARRIGTPMQICFIEDGRMLMLCVIELLLCMWLTHEDTHAVRRHTLATIAHHSTDLTVS